MDKSVVRTAILDQMRRHRKSLEDARITLVQGFGLTDTTVIDEVVEEIRAEGEKNQLLEIPAGVRAETYNKAVTADARESHWYVGPTEGDEYWPALRERLLAGPLADAIDEIDAASTKVVAHFADPGIRRLKKKGLVIGYVQSGKTANYTAVIAKAADAGYRTFIILSGLHNNLRKQTQARILSDLGTTSWGQLTTEEADFGTVINGSALMAQGVHLVAVVKKNASRLRRLRDWLRDIDEGIRARTPILLLDDEADQATPNSAAARNELTKINALIREIWGEVITGSYVGYTATPFANVFMDPDDEEELYPSDFILDLPRSDKYFGAERIFGRTALDDADDPDDGLDMVRRVPDDEADSLKPPARKEDRVGFDPELPGSLVDAIRWFLLATAIRHIRGQDDKHSSMLIHTTAFVAPHFTMKARVQALLGDLRREVHQGAVEEFRRVFDNESGRVTGVTSERMPAWKEVLAALPQVISTTRVVVDNGLSDDRLDYGRRDEEGRTIPETVIAIGGSTLSRGLTLEGLVVSYFVRTANTYDTLLQMGRWFGYRPGYEDLPRIWMPEDLAEDFVFLATVEEEIRRDMRRLERMNVTPREFGLRVRAHPGRLSITSKAKMAHAELVRVTYAGQRHQTIVLHEKDREALEHNIVVTRDLIRHCREACPTGVETPARTQFFGVEASRIIEFLTRFRFHPDQPGLRSDHIVGWIRRSAPDSVWNVVVLGTEKRFTTPDGQPLDLGTLDLGLRWPLPLVNRAPLATPDNGVANIKALLSQQDWLADFDPDLARDLRRGGESFEQIREREADANTGMLVVYGVSKHSIPLRPTQANARRAMKAEEHLVGLGLFFPRAAAGEVTEGDYYSVRPDWEAVLDEDIDLPPDTEGSAVIDGDALTVGGSHD